LVAVAGLFRVSTIKELCRGDCPEFAVARVALLGVLSSGLADELTARGTRFQAVDARSSVRDRLRSEGVDSKLGGVNRLASVADVVEDFQKQSRT
jgi:hypothetical protein